MDNHAVNSAGNPTVPPPKIKSSSSSSEYKEVPSALPKASDDAVNLSSDAQSLLTSKLDEQTLLNNQQRKYSVTENNDVVLQVIDPKTQEVVKSIPTKEQIELKNAVRDGIKNIKE
jgi:uncharacterized FlaG/YvyC family protein